MFKVANLSAEYGKKLVTADQAVKVVKSGDRVHYGLFNGLVFDLDKALAKRTQELADVIIMTTIWAQPEPPQILTADPEAKHFKYLSTHFSALDRKANKQGCCWAIPVQFRENPKYWSENVGDIDVAMFQVAPMDKYGNFNLGPQVAEYWGIIERAKVVIVEVNNNQPIAQGYQNTINLSQITYVVEGSNSPLPVIKAKAPGDIDKKIGQLIVERIQNGSTLQLGVGGLPNYVGALLADSEIKDLSVHSEMFVDAYLKLYMEGKITGNKNLDKGKMVYTFAQGSEDLYAFIEDNPILCVAPVDYVNAVEVIAANDNVVSINSCLQVDLFGQVNSESAGLQHIGGTGGQLDFVMGAFKSKGGQSFLCTPATRVNKDGSKESLITPRLPEGSIVSVPRGGTHYIVTEYGMANLKGKSTWERSELLISIAHPDFREELIREAERMGIWKNTSKITY
ncbi:MAG: acetyl-CoA hydrolase/transferase C-terminal domain-containing protein [Anaerolineaceae bacterium]|nr:acetyl-CoA hydrolase/transferase C-terminal domain-containing protein [Anaerolineaceae bacterium]